MRVNFLKEQRPIADFNWLRIIIIGLFLLIIFLLVINYYDLFTSLNELEIELANLDDELKLLLPQRAEYYKLQREIARLEEVVQEEDRNYFNWAEVIREQGYLIPEKMTFYYLAIESDKITIEGFAANNQEVIKFLNNMKKSPLFDEVQLTNLKAKEEINFQIRALISGESD